MHSVLSWLQWPAMGASVLAAWWVASTSSRRRTAGFWIFLASNLLWTVWGIGDRAYAVIALQVALAALNLRGIKKNTPGAEEPAKASV